MHHKGKKESEKEILRKEEKIINKVTKIFFKGIRTQTLRISSN